jgi:hypothetical protein
MVKKNSGNFKTLNDSWNKAELKAKNDSNLVQLMVWGIYRTYHKKAIDNFLNGIMTVSVTELDIKYLKSSFTENLLNLNIQLN